MFIMIFVELMSEVRSGYIHLSHVFFYESYAFHNINHSEVRFKFILFWRPSCTFEVIVLYGSSMHLKKEAKRVNNEHHRIGQAAALPLTGSAQAEKIHGLK